LGRIDHQEDRLRIFWDAALLILQPFGGSGRFINPHPSFFQHKTQFKKTCISTLMVRRKKNKDSFTNEERRKKKWQAGIKESEGEKYSGFSLRFL
jgi:hypothetical protein